MPEIIDIVANCPVCETPHTIARAVAGGGQVYVPDCTVRCEKCRSVYIASGAILAGSLAPVFSYLLPLAEGDAGGSDALLLG